MASISIPSQNPVPSPCVSRCSTASMGDLVCRGCKRYQHEVSHWNITSEEVKARVMNRLAEEKWSAFRLIFSGIDIEQAFLEIERQLNKKPFEVFDVMFGLWELMSRNQSTVFTQGLWSLELRPAKLSMYLHHPIGKIFAELEKQLYQTASSKYDLNYRPGPK